MELERRAREIAPARYRRRRPETTLLYRVAQTHLASFKSWFDLLDSLQSSTPLKLSSEARAFLDSCLRNLDLVPEPCLKTCAEIPGSISQLQCAFVETSELADPLLVTFRFCDPGRLTTQNTKHTSLF